MVIGIIENTLTDGSSAFDVALVTEGRSARWPMTTESDAIAFAFTLQALIEAHSVAPVPDIWGLPAGEVLDGLSGRKEKMLPALNELPAVEEARGSSIIKAFSPASVRTLLTSLGVVSPINPVPDAATLVDTSPALLSWQSRPDGEMLGHSRGWIAFFGLDLAASLKGWENLIHYDDAAIHFERWLKALSTGEPYVSEARYRCADGEYRPILVRATPLRDERKQIVRWHGSNTPLDGASVGDVLSQLVPNAAFAAA